jgi:hypothetical protein
VIRKKIIDPTRIRKINGGFSFIPHRFLADGFLAALTKNEILLYLFLVMAADRYGLSFYNYDAICSLTHLTLDQYIEARDALMVKSLIAFDGTLFQVLKLPASLPCAKLKEHPGAKRLAVLAQKAVKGF